MVVTFPGADGTIPTPPEPPPGVMPRAQGPALSSLLRIHEIGAKSLQDGNVCAFLGEVLDINIDVTESDFGDVQLLDPPTQQLRILTQRGLTEGFVKYFDGIPLGQEACGRALERKARVVVEDVRVSPLFSEEARRTLLDAQAVACQLTPLVSRDGQPLGVISTHYRRPYELTAQQLQVVDVFAQQASDFIEHSRSRQELQTLQALFAREQASREQAELAIRATDHFIATLAHELRQPLAAIFPALEVQQRSLSPERRQRATEVIQQQLRHMARLVDDLSDASAASRGAIELSCEQLDLRAVVQRALDMTASLINDKDQHTTLILGGEPTWILADETRLTQVFSNLLRNASVYTPAGGQISIAIAQGTDHVTCTLRDNGIGVPPHATDRIFELFERGEHGKSLPGIGIGLAVVRQLVELHGGTVSVRSEGPGLGSEFTVTLPVMGCPKDADGSSTGVP